MFKNYRFLIILNVIQGNHNAKVTLFEDVAKIIIGCSTTEYVNSVEKVIKLQLYVTSIYVTASSTL